MKACLRLRQKMLEHDYNNAELAQEIHRCPAYVSEALCAKTLLDAADMYAIAAALEIPTGEWGDVFFPPEVVRLISRKLEERS